MRVLVVNAGSSSMKLSLLSPTDELEEVVELPADADSQNTDGVDTDELARVLAQWPAPDAVGHRIVHGGALFTAAVPITGTVTDQLTSLTDLAPLHQPKSLAALAAVTALLPDVPAVACFDTAFHATMPAEAFTYAVPEQWRHEFGVRRYGFHGLSHAYASRRAAELVDRPLDELRIVTCHLGAGASLCAVLRGRSVDTTMGFTPLEGLVMATRSGTVDPGLVLWLQEHQHLSAHDVSTALEQHSGLLGLAGTPDMRQIELRENAAAVAALEVYLHRLVGCIASMTAAAGGLDLLVFTGGVGENSAGIRRGVVDRLGWAGVAMDLRRNAAADGDTDVTADGSSIKVAVIAAREDLQIARETRSVMGV